MAIKECGHSGSKDCCDCGSHGHDDDDCDQRPVLWQLCACITGIIVLTLFIILIVWLVLRPTKPRFFLKATSVSQLNVTQNFNCLTTVMQVTIAAQNPNNRIGIFYDRLDVYASYIFQQITPPTRLPPTYQRPNDIALWSPYLCGFNVPINPFLGNALYKDILAGYILLHVKIDGRIRWKVGSWISDHYHLFVHCPAVLVTHEAVPFRFQQITQCSVEI
ncbi:hypothetical protein LUZ62_046845 [Rhynchospora pubera]|uniref:Late embryogenesis abundant protein LEA-2 subgroup domain-containing protein n=1 Tax=Rhynchospora pubera TaxID=906938 RepID=A0AAV8CC35_9POAL|nr:hypothetical protein LUZ62_085853 [Rhynchospora pubera]KAJ4766703.1 hypothetical protein LUZ62_077078 [Rhynchospora pubera]KAJ4795599.1 hypothetical protein LUZ62_046845 [Rhynchospora pubera]